LGEEESREEERFDPSLSARAAGGGGGGAERFDRFLRRSFLVLHSSAGLSRRALDDRLFIPDSSRQSSHASALEQQEEEEEERSALTALPCIEQLGGPIETYTRR